MLDARHRKAAELLAEGKMAKVDIAAHPEVGVSERAIYDWLKKPEFQNLIDKYIAEMDRAVARTFHQRAQEAADVLYKLITDPRAGAKVKTTAAVEILNRGGQKPKDVIITNPKEENPLNLDELESLENGE